MELSYKKVYKVPFEIDNCPFCCQPLSQLFMTPIGYGKHCKICNVLFVSNYDCSPNVNADCKFLHKYDVETFKNFNTIPSAYKQFVLFGDTDIRICTVLCNSKFFSPNKGYVLFNSHDYQVLFSAELNHTPIYGKSKQKYTIVKTRYSKYISTQKRYLESEIVAANLKRDYLGYLPGYEIPTLTSQNIAHVYKGLNPCNKNAHPVSGFWALFEIPGFEDEDFYIEYCHKCEKFLMSYDDYEDYLHRLHLFPMQVKLRESFRWRHSEREEISLLRLAGYTVDKSYGYSSLDRQKILAYIMDSGMLKQTYILDHLRANIEYNGRNPNMEEAREKWMEDRNFVLNYKLKEKPLVLIGRIRRKGR